MVRGPAGAHSSRNRRFSFRWASSSLHHDLVGDLPCGVIKHFIFSQAHNFVLKIAGVIQKGLCRESGEVQANHFLAEVVALWRHCACRMCSFDKLDLVESNLAAVIVQLDGSSEDENTERLWKEELALCNARLALLGGEA
jgi:hypothetical protein